MRIGMVGCGKLGLMVALTIESKGHDVLGFDINPKISDYLKERKIPFKEFHSEELLSNTKMRMVSLRELVKESEIIFMAVQTPHEPEYEGVTRIPNERADFNYSYLKNAVKGVNDCIEKLEEREEEKKDRIVVIISTVLPGTIDREIRPLMGKHFKLVYEPLFIAMGTVYQDYLNPEFVLMGVDIGDSDKDKGRKSAQILENFYKTIHDKPVFKTDIRSAEAIKVFYNTFITMKTVLGNIYGEMAYKLGANADDIYRALSMATDRVISRKYLKSGMGDGGACHPRDNIALSYIARKAGVSFDIFDALMSARELHAEWLANLIIDKQKEKQKETGFVFPIILLGKTFKPETELITGSSAMLLSNILFEKNIEHIHYDPYVDSSDSSDSSNDVELKKAIYFIATKHDIFTKTSFVPGSIVIDPFRYIGEQKDVSIIRIG